MAKLSCALCLQRERKSDPVSLGFVPILPEVVRVAMMVGPAVVYIHFSPNQALSGLNIKFKDFVCH